ncbi:hypothetical protein Ancab_031720 [Ancistrocladus abbreviatus]
MELEKRAPKLVEDRKNILMLHGTKTASSRSAVLTEIYNLQKGSAVKYTKKNENIRPLGRDFLERKSCESVDELKHLKEVLLDLLQGEAVENLNIAGLDRIYICTAVSSNRVFVSHYAVRLKKSGTIVPRIELVNVGPSMDFVVRRHGLPNEDLRKEAMKRAPEQCKKVENVKGDALLGKIGKIYILDQKVGDAVLPNKAKRVKRERCEAKMTNEANEHASKKQNGDSD